MKNIILLLVLAFISMTTHAGNSQTSFFELMNSHCGKVYYGKTVFPEDKTDPFVGKMLKMSVNQCSENEIRVPFQVGKDTSRTWILTQTEQGLLFKHDHRLADGSPDPVTLYGGFANDAGNEVKQFFPADSHTKKLIPAASSNVWSLEFDPKRKQFIYYLERHNKPRFKAIFDLNPAKL